MTLLRLLNPFWPLVGVALLLALIPAVAQAYLPTLVVRPLFDQILGQGQFGALGGVLWVGAGLLGLLVVGGYALEAFIGYLSVRIPAYWRERIFGALLGAQLGAVPGSAGGLATRVVADLRELETFLFYGLGAIVLQGVSLAALLAQLLLRYTELTLYLLLMLPVLALLLGWLGSVVTQYSQRTQAALERIAGRMSEGFGRLELIRALGLEGFARRRFEQANATQFRLARRRMLVSAFNLPMGQLFTTLLVGFLLALGVGAVGRGQMTTGDLTAFLTLLALAITPLQTLSRAGVLYAQGEGSAARLAELLDLPPAPQGGNLRPERLRGELELEKVGFGYGGQAVLNDVSLSVMAGSMVGLVGASGSGKSTLLRLLLGLYRPTQGQILLDGHGLAEYDQEWLRSKVAWVPQEPLLFAGSLRENLGALAPQASPPQMLEALAAVGLSDLSLAYPIDEGGGGLSVGQRQRVAIAAALLRDARVLLLDEITSALDRTSEAQVVAALEAARRGRTVIVVAHRLSTVRQADQIVVMDAGRVVEHGTHADLLMKSGVYSRLWQG
ncbi:MAG: ABC transporter ATP-binding protein [Meiothermus sp.]|nr:ABC transporter ATP-binding protein [Meiothermus sp.]